ncbi:helix-turn-helix domain-containing protein [Pseudoalteromonas neustonica]|uniref:Helix-turn-helix domain-containing protein n=2 Tax=Pseudoalteromonas TaxID=53246 RepID=A0ABU9TXV3_9GAMM
MNAYSYLLFFFSSLGAFNGVILALWLFVRKNKQPSDTWLAVLLLLISVRIAKSVAFYFIPTLDKSILQIGLTACCLLGPCLVVYTYTKSKSVTVNNFPSRLFICLVGIVFTIGMIYPYNENLELWQYWLYRGSSYLWFVCLIIASYLYYSRFKEVAGNWKQLLSEQTFITIVGCSLIWLAYFTASYTSYIMGAISFSVVLYLSSIILLKPPSPSSNKIDKYANNKLSKEQAEHYSILLNQLMAKDQLYIDPQLTLPRLAKRLSTSHTVLSQLLNKHYQMNFKQYVNSLRVACAKELLLARPNTSIDDIAEQSGFSAPSTFYNAFKQQTGLTPNKYRALNL